MFGVLSGKLLGYMVSS
jgi:hypothetical protein